MISNIVSVLFITLFFAVQVYFIFSYFRLPKTNRVEAFGDKFFPMLEDTKYKRKSIRSNYLSKGSLIMVPIFFFAKRLCLVLILLGAGSYLWVQIAMLNSMAVASIIYVMWFMPFENKSMNYIEVMNEVTLLLLTYTLWCFTDFVPEAETRHLLGFVFIATSQGNVIVHLILMVCETMKRIELGCKRCINRRKASASQKTTGQQLRRGLRSSDL